MNISKTKVEFELLFGGNTNVPNILIFTEHVNATYYISFDIPLKVMYENGEVNFAVLSQNFVAEKGLEKLDLWNGEFLPSLVIMTRYALPFGREILDFFRSKSIPVIYHIDDDLLYIPESLGEEIQKRQGASEVIESRTYLLQNCDLIYASTEHLSNVLETRFPHQKVYFGIYATFREGLVKGPKPSSDSVIIGYMGSKGHQNDLALVEDALVRLMNEIPNLRFEVFGTIKMPEKLEQFDGRVKSHRVNKNYFEFVEYLANLNWDLGLAPLENVDFNHCKAPTKYIEYTSTGIPVAATDIALYRNAAIEKGICLVRHENWYHELRRLIENPQLREDLVHIAQSHCAQKFSKKILVAQLRSLISCEL